VLCIAGPAAAQQGPSFAELKKQGDDAMQALHYREALDAYDRAVVVGHSDAIFYNRARAQQGLGDYPAALDSIEEFVRVASDDLKARVPQLAELVADIRNHVAFVVVTCSVVGATVIVQGKIVGVAPLSAPLRVTSGNVAIAVEASGYVPLRIELMTVGGKSRTVDARLVSEELVERQGPRVHVDIDGWRVTAFTLGAVGLGGLALGATSAGLVALDTSAAQPHCVAKMCDAVGWSDVNDAKTFATISTVSFIAGGVLVAGAAALFLLAPHTARRMAFVPLIGPGFVGIGGSL
jgi:hypothetical protein